MEALLHNLVQAMGWSILHSLWQSALIYALLLPSQMKIFGLNAKQKYAMAYGSVCLMFAAFAFTFSMAFHWPSEAAKHNFAVQALALPSAIPANFASTIERIFPFLVLLYSVGLIIQSVIVVQGYRKVQALRRSAYAAIPESWQLLFSSLKDELKIKKDIKFRLSDHVSVPLVIGFFKPVILFPVALAAQMDLKQVETILIHELSHIRRNDYLFNLMKTLIDTILFFNPFVWLAGRFIHIEREHDCDDLVLKLRHTPLTYAHALLTLELITDQSKPVLALAATGENQHLYQRIKRITDMKTTYVNSRQKLFAVTLTFATILSLAWINPSEKGKTAHKVEKVKKVFTTATEISRQDTSKNKVKTKIIKFVQTEYVPTPPPPMPPSKRKKVPVAPKAPGKKPAVPQVPKAPAAPAAPDMQMIAPLTDMVVKFSTDVVDMTMAHFNGQDEASIRKMQAELEKKGAELERKFNSAEQKAKWKKIAEDMKAQAHSQENQELMKKAQQQAKMAAIDAQKIINDPQFKKDLEAIKITHGQPMRIVFENEQTKKVKESPEYLELKKKFDKDVEELMSKNNQKEQK